MKEAIEEIKRKVIFDPKKDKKCKCKDYMELGYQVGRLKFTKKGYVREIDKIKHHRIPKISSLFSHKI